jgi:hypothetical protein
MEVQGEQTWVPTLAQDPQGPEGDLGAVRGDPIGQGGFPVEAEMGRQDQDQKEERPFLGGTGRLKEGPLLERARPGGEQAPQEEESQEVEGAPGHEGPALALPAKEGLSRAGREEDGDGKKMVSWFRA